MITAGTEQVVEGSSEPPIASAGTRRARRLAAALILAVTVAAVAVVVGVSHQVVRWTGVEWIAGGALAVAILVTELFPLHLRHTTETATYSVTDVVWTAAMILAPRSVLLVAVAAGVLGAQAFRRMPSRKAAFNTGQFVVAMWMAEALFGLVPHSGPLDAATWGAAGAAMALNFVVNEALVGLVISLMEGERLGAVMRASLGVDVLHAVGNVAIGIMVAVMWALAPGGVLVAAVPVLLSYLAYAGALGSLRERDRMRDLYRAGQVLLERLETAGDFSMFLELVARMMDADSAELVVVRDGVAVIHGPTGVATVIPSAGSRPATAGSYHGDRSGVPMQSAAIRGPGGESGSLGVFRRRALSPTERSLLEALAAQVYVKLRHSTVFSRSVAREQELERIISSTSDGIFVVGEDGRIRSWSPAMQRITGVRADAAIDRPLADVLVAPDGEESVWERFGDSARSSPNELETAAFVRDDGTVGWVRCSRSALRSHLGEPLGVVAVARDVSADIRAEQAKSNFIAAISHELRTPLTPLKGYLSMFAAGQLGPGPEGAETFRTMLRQTDRLEHLINDLLDASQMETGVPLIRREEVDPAGLIAEAVAESDPGMAARVTFDVDSTEPVLADGLRVKQVLLNLLSNAVKYSPADGPIGVAASTRDGMCTISVSDAGVGIPASEQARIFDRFYRVDNGSTRATGGVGLGLYIAKQLVESMGGRLWVCSEPGAGSTFSFSLQLAGRVEVDIGETPSAGRQTARLGSASSW